MADKNLIGKKIKAVPKPKTEIGIDTDNTLIKEITEGAISSKLDLSSIENFLTNARTRENKYQLIDTMAQDSTIASILETYAEDITETNDEGEVIWAEADDVEIANYVNFLLKSLNVNKYAYGWAYSLCKYGDVYLRLYRESDYKSDIIFDEDGVKETLNEDINVVVNKKDDKYVMYVEKVVNPCTMMELTRLGKTAGFIEVPSESLQKTDNLGFTLDYNLYRLNKQDINIYNASAFVHILLDDNSSRIPEEVNLFLNDEDFNNNTNAYSYKVKSGQSLLYNSFKIWRQLTLLENSVLLNRITKSSIVRIIGVQVGDMPKENVQKHLTSIKNLIEQKTAFDNNTSISEYTNPGPIENNIYIPLHGEQGAISTSQIGGEYDPKQLTDIEYFNNKLFGSFRVPKQYFGFTDDGAGFNGGTSLTILSSRYGKAIKRLQNALICGITDLVNLFLIDKGLVSYINKFKIKMTAPLTQEEIDKRDNISNRIRVVGDIMQTLSDIQSPTMRLKIIKSLLSSVITDQDVINYIDEEIEAQEKGEEQPQEEEEESGNEFRFENDFKTTPPRETGNDINAIISGEVEEEPSENETPTEEQGEEQPTPQSSQENEYLPRPSELGNDFTQTEER